MEEVSALHPSDARAIAAQKRRIAAVEEGFGGTWIEAMRAAPNVSRVEDIARPMFEAALGRRVFVDLASDTTHLISAKEIATALITLSIAYSEADLSAVEFGEISGYDGDTSAVMYGGDDGAEVVFSAEDYSARTRFGRISNNLDSYYGDHEYVVQPPAGAASVALHEFSHVLQFTLATRLGPAAAQADGSDLRPTKSELWNTIFDRSRRPTKAIPGSSKDLLEDLRRVSRRTAGNAERQTRVSTEKNRGGAARQIDMNILEQWGEGIYDKVKDEVSTYALKSYLEFGAESFSSVTGDPAPSEVARVGHARLMRALGRPPGYVAPDLTANLAAVREGTPLDDILGVSAYISPSETERVRRAWQLAIDEFGRERWTAPTPEQRFDAVAAALPGGDWQQAMRDAPDVKTVEKLTRDLVKASLGAPFKLDMAPKKGTDLLSAKEVGTALVVLAREYPRTRLDSVCFDTVSGADDLMGLTERISDDTTSRMVLNIDHLKKSGRLKLTDQLMRGWTGGEGALPPSAGAAGVAVQEFANALCNTAEQSRPDWAPALSRQRQQVTAGFVQTTFFRDVGTKNRNGYGRLMNALSLNAYKHPGTLRATVAAVTAGADDNARIGLDRAPDLPPEERQYYRNSWRVAVANEPDGPDAPGSGDKTRLKQHPADRRVHRPQGAPAQIPNSGKRQGQSRGLERGQSLER